MSYGDFEGRIFGTVAQKHERYCAVYIMNNLHFIVR